MLQQHCAKNIFLNKYFLPVTVNLSNKSLKFLNFMCELVYLLALQKLMFLFFLEIFLEKL